MKRYRVLKIDFDTRATILNMDVPDTWEPRIQKMWHEHKYSIREGLLAQYGTQDGFQKIKNYTDMGDVPFSIISFHNKFFRQIREAFIVGAFYPSLTSACALGERILNQLILQLKESFRSTVEYKKIYRKESINDWELAISTLENWNILLPGVITKFRELMDLRHRSLHFNPETDTNDRELALKAISIFSGIIKEQFSIIGPAPWLFNSAGAFFIKKSAETIPFVNKIVIPACFLVGPNHSLERTQRDWVVHDKNEYENKQISDEEFAQMYERKTDNSITNPS